MHGRNWKQVATFIPSRTIVQIRTHAQKYFAKLTKVSVAGRGERGGRGKKGIPERSVSIGKGYGGSCIVFDRNFYILFIL